MIGRGIKRAVRFSRERVSCEDRSETVRVEGVRETELTVPRLAAR